MHNQLTRTDTNETIVLPQDLRWTDEHEWSAIAQSEPQRTLSGSLIIQQGKKQAGRPITLQADNVWIPRATVNQLREWTDEAELKMTYAHHDGRTFHVIFALHQQALTAEPVNYSTPETENEHYTITLKLITIQAA